MRENSWACSHMHGPGNFCLRSRNNVVNSCSNIFNLMLSIEVMSNGIIGLHKFLKFLLKAVVLVIQVGHVPVKSINLTL